MDVTVLPGTELPDDLVGRWTAIQDGLPEFDSPFFAPQFTRAVAAVRDDVEVAVLQARGEPVGFFPFQRKRWNVGKPVGGPMSDFQGVVVRPEMEWTAQELMRGCRLAAWDFDHLLTSQRQLRTYCRATTVSPYLDLSAGFEAYKAALNTSLFKKLGQKRRKFAREIGPIRFEFDPPNREELFRTVVSWKARQYANTHVTNVFAYPWTVELLQRLLDEKDRRFTALISALYAGDRLTSVHLWLRRGSVLHAWFPAYDPEFAIYSPGMLLLEDAARVAEAEGIRRIDLGRGTTDFKTWFMSAAVEVGEGSVACNPVARAWRRTWHFTRQRIRASRLNHGARLVGRLTRPIRAWLTFH